MIAKIIIITWVLVLKIKKDEKYKIKKLKKFNINPVNEFIKTLFLLVFLRRNINNNWCKWNTSGLNGEYFFLIFLSKENNISNEGYHKSVAI